MKVYFSASSDVGEDKRTFYKNIIDLLENKGLKVEQSIFSCLSEQVLNIADDFNFVYNAVLKKIDSSDLFIADISDPSGGVGYQVYHAIYTKKPIIIIYSGKSAANPSVIIRGIRSKRVIILDYTDFNELKSKLTPAISKAEKMLKVRFHLVMNNNDSSFIENISERTGISKTRYINKLISEARKRDGLK